MSFFKTVALFLAVIVANPFCCCSAGSTAQIEQPTEHSCCQSSLQAEQEPEQNAQCSGNECPHSQEKNSQISQSVDSSHSFFKTPHFFAYAFSFFEAIDRNKLVSETINTLPSSSPLPIVQVTQTHCVYLL